MTKAAGLFLIFSFFGPLQAKALDFVVIGPCEEKPVLKTSIASQDVTLGELTVQVLTENKISFQGDRSGIKVIANSPAGDEALEVISDTQLKAYGWCVAIDGQQPGLMPDEVRLSADTKEVVWFYAYAFYDQGVWKSFCTPSYQNKPSQICPKNTSELR